MILNNAINAGNFIYCMAHFSPNESNTYHNQGNGHFHQYLYIVDGQGIVENRETADGPAIRREEGNGVGILVDLTDTRGLFHTTITNENSLTVILFNPIPETRNLKVEIIKGEQSQIITANDSRKVIVCITGPVIANNKTLMSLQHAKIFPGKTVELAVPKHSVCAIVSE